MEQSRKSNAAQMYIERETTVITKTSSFSSSLGMGAFNVKGT